MKIRFLWLFVGLFCFVLQYSSVHAAKGGLVKKDDSPKIGTRGQTEDKPTTSTWKKGETPTTDRKGPEAGSHRTVSKDTQEEDLTTGDEEGEDEGAGTVKGKTDKKKTSKAKKVGKAIEKVTENPAFNELLKFGLDRAGKAIDLNEEERRAQSKAKLDADKRAADLEYEKKLLAIKREDEKERLELEKFRKDLDLSYKRKAEAKERLARARQEEPEAELTGEMAEEGVSAQEEQKIEEAVPELKPYPEVLKEEFEEVLTNPDFIKNADKFINNLKTFVYINIGGEPESNDPQELKDAYSSTNEFLDNLIKAVDEGKINILKPKLTEIKTLKNKMPAIELDDFLTEAKKIIANQSRFPIENQVLFLRGISEWVYYAVNLKKDGKFSTADEARLISVLQSIPFGEKVTSMGIKQLRETKKSEPAEEAGEEMIGTNPEAEG